MGGTSAQEKFLPLKGFAMPSDEQPLALFRSAALDYTRRNKNLLGSASVDTPKAVYAYTAVCVAVVVFVGCLVSWGAFTPVLNTQGALTYLGEVRVVALRGGRVQQLPVEQGRTVDAQQRLATVVSNDETAKAGSEAKQVEAMAAEQQQILAQAELSTARQFEKRNVRGGVKLPHSGGCVLHFAGGVKIPRH